eukprot:scaffold14437_cov124-Isochrysis_galbana.AAC.4
MAGNRKLRLASAAASSANATCAAVAEFRGDAGRAAVGEADWRRALLRGRGGYGLPVLVAAHQVQVEAGRGRKAVRDAQGRGRAAGVGPAS